jgi:hypothetical protein
MSGHPRQGPLIGLSGKIDTLADVTLSPAAVTVAVDIVTVLPGLRSQRMAMASISTRYAGLASAETPTVVRRCFRSDRVVPASRSSTSSPDATPPYPPSGGYTQGVFYGVFHTPGLHHPADCFSPTQTG